MGQAGQVSRDRPDTKIEGRGEISAGEPIHTRAQNSAGAPESVQSSDVVYENHIDTPSQCSVPTPTSNSLNLAHPYQHLSSTL